MFSFTVSTAFLAVISAVGIVLAEEVVALFRAEDAEMVAIGAATLRWQCATFPLVALPTCTNMLFQNIRMTVPATLLSICRNGLYFLPAVVLLPMTLGLKGVEMAQAVADALTFVTSVPYAIWISRKLKRGMV